MKLQPISRPFILILIALAACPVFAQRDNDPLSGNSFEISGQVRSGSKKAAVENVLVSLESATGAIIHQTTTDSVGRFRFSSLGHGQFTVSIRVLGFKAEKQPVELTSVARRAQLFFELTPEKSAAAPAHPNHVIDARVPAEAQKEFEKGQSALSEKRPDKALSHFEKAVSLYPAFFQAHLLLGITYRETQQWDKAERALRRTLELKPRTAMALVELGEVYRRQKKFAEAEKVLLEGLQLDADLWQGHFTLGRVYWEMNQPAKAGPPVGRALQLKPDYAEAHLLGGNIFMRVGLPQNALVEYEEYLRLAPQGEFAEQTKEIVQKLKRALAEKKQ
jgi:tetratricopeptide (TPR) repeat protein